MVGLVTPEKDQKGSKKACVRSAFPPRDVPWTLSNMDLSLTERPPMAAHIAYALVVRIYVPIARQLNSEVNMFFFVARHVVLDSETSCGPA